MPTPRNTESVYTPAISALTAELADLESRTAETRALIEALCAHAGITGDPATSSGAVGVPWRTPSRITGDVAGDKLIEQAEAKKRQKESGGHGKKKTLRAAAKGIGTALPPETPTLAELDVSKAKWVKVLTARADAVEAERAARDPEQLKTAVAERLGVERTLGGLLKIIDGRARPLPGATHRNSRTRWVSLAGLTPADFAKVVEREARRALVAIGVKPAPAKRKRAPQPRLGPPPRMKLTPWTQEPDGSLSRTLTSVDAKGAEAPPP